MLALLPAPQAIYAEAEPRLPAATESGTAFDWSDLQPMFCASVLPILGPPFSTELTADFIRVKRYDIKFLMKQSIKRCEYCGHLFGDGNRFACTLDHVIPTSKGGSHFATNLRLCCKRCNSFKNNLMPEQWAELLQRMANSMRSIVASEKEGAL